MAGKRKSGRGFAGQYTVESIDFWWNDPRVEQMSAATKVFFWYTTQAAVKERRETLPLNIGVTYIARRAGLAPRYAHSYLSTLVNLSLLKVEDDGRITVCGVKKRHSNLAWKDGEYTEPIRDANGAQAVSDKRLRDESALGARDSRVIQEIHDAPDYLSDILNNRRPKASA